MFKIDTLDINLLTIQEVPFAGSYKLETEYFNQIDSDAVNDGNVCAEVTVAKVADGEYSLVLKVEGTVIVPCDRCLDDMEQPIKGESTYIVKLGQESCDDDDIIIVAEDEGVLSTSWLIYETIALAVPIKHVHAPGKCNDAMTQKLQELSATRSGDEEGEEAIDPRWADLLKLKH